MINCLLKGNIFAAFCMQLSGLFVGVGSLYALVIKLWLAAQLRPRNTSLFSQDLNLLQPQ